MAYNLHTSDIHKEKDSVIIFATSEYSSSQYPSLNWVAKDFEELNKYWEGYNIIPCHDYTVARMTDQIKQLFEKRSPLQGTFSVHTRRPCDTWMLLGTLLFVITPIQNIHGWGYGIDYRDYNSNMLDNIRKRAEDQSEEHLNWWKPRHLLPPSPSARKDEYASSVDKRASNYYQDPFSPNIPLPWNCEKAVNWEDLGPQHFPRYVRNVTCRQDSCWYGSYKCVPKTFILKVLCLALTGCRGSVDEVPSELQPRWMITSVSVTSACECGRNS